MLIRKPEISDLLTANLHQAWRLTPTGWTHYGPACSREECDRRMAAAREIHAGVQFLRRRLGIKPSKQDVAPEGEREDR